jgi:Zn-dependent protease with chaperone function
MDFFERQEQAHRNTKLFVLYFALGVGLLILAIYGALLMLLSGLASGHNHDLEEAPARIALWNPSLFAGVSLGTLAVITVSSLFRTVELSQGGSSVAEMLGGRLVNPNTTDPDERKLLNVVEEMALAAGLPVPPVYILDQEQGINAFAAGHTHSDAVVAVTRNCMKLLTRDELQGIIGHEFSHILNGDMRLNLRLMGLIFGILCLAIIGRILLMARGGGRDRNALPLVGLVLLVFGSIGAFFAHLIQAAVSRQREFLADASSVQFTRNPAGIVGALKKIGGLDAGSKLEAARASEAAHMYFGNGVGRSLLHALDTHPPLEDRIRAIDPAWDGAFPMVALPSVQAPGARTTAPPPRLPIPFPFPGAAQSRQAGLGRLAPPIIAAQAVLPGLGNLTTSHLEYADRLRSALPDSLRTAARDPLGASALIYALLLSPKAELRAPQLDLVSRNSSSAARRETERLLPDVAAVATHAKLPLMDLALPSLGQMSPAQYQQFSQTVQALIESDGEMDLHEYVLQKIVRRHLAPRFAGARKPVVQYYAFKPLAPDCSVLLSALAFAGADDAGRAAAAFRQGAGLLNAAGRVELEFLPPGSCDLPQVDVALNRLANAAPQIKKTLLAACAQTVAADGLIQEAEAELLRAVADTLDCPIPPFFQPRDDSATTPARSA